MKRTLKPRAPTAVLAVYVSQLNCQVLLGVDPRRYLDLVLPLCRGHVTALGKLRLVPLDVVVDALREKGCASDAGAKPDEQDDDIADNNAAQTVDEFLARVGRVRIRGASRSTPSDAEVHAFFEDATQAGDPTHSTVEDLVRGRR